MTPDPDAGRQVAITETEFTESPEEALARMADLASRLQSQVDAYCDRLLACQAVAHGLAETVRSSGHMSPATTGYLQSQLYALAQQAYVWRITDAVVVEAPIAE